MAERVRVSTRRIDGWLVGAGLLMVTGCAWVATVTTTSGMEGMPATEMPGHAHVTGPAPLAAMVASWTVMMVAMMAPSAAPIALTYATVVGRSAQTRRALALTASLVGGYLLAWTLFAIAAAITQSQLTRLAIVEPEVAALSPVPAGVLLLAAGAYQFAPLKHTCLRRCRAPLGYLLGHWADGMTGAVTMGARHGAWCTGCCWALMALLFAVGTMNALWMALIAALVLTERAVPGGHVLARLAGVALLGWGAWHVGGAALPALAGS
jgi:predicted metal-binding membrane protein